MSIVTLVNKNTKLAPKIKFKSRHIAASIKYQNVIFNEYFISVLSFCSNIFFFFYSLKFANYFFFHFVFKKNSLAIVALLQYKDEEKE